MATQSVERYFGVHAAALELRARRLDLLASNIANAATPGYKARDLDFGKQLAAAEGRAPLAATAGGHLGAPGTGAGARPGFRVPVQPALDGNTVELQTEQTLFAENAVRYQAGLSFLSGRVSTLMAALKGE